MLDKNHCCFGLNTWSKLGSFASGMGLENGLVVDRAVPGRLQPRALAGGSGGGKGVDRQMRYFDWVSLVLGNCKVLPQLDAHKHLLW